MADANTLPDKPAAAPRRAPVVQPVPGPANDLGEAEMPLRVLAEGILSREVRPRTADIRRLAEAVLALSAPKPPKKKKAKAAAADKAAGKKAGDKKKKKLAKIPRTKPKG